MLQFDPADPFPLLPPDSHSYADAQAHSEQADAWLGLETARVESSIRRKYQELGLEDDPDHQLWIGLTTRSMLTPYTEFRALLSKLAPHPGQTVADLGAGYGRM